jgi:hypothetical protein
MRTRRTPSFSEDHSTFSMCMANTRCERIEFEPLNRLNPRKVKSHHAVMRHFLSLPGSAPSDVNARKLRVHRRPVPQIKGYRAPVGFTFNVHSPRWDENNRRSARNHGPVRVALAHALSGVRGGHGFRTTPKARWGGPLSIRAHGNQTEISKRTDRLL